MNLDPDLVRDIKYLWLPPASKKKSETFFIWSPVRSKVIAIFMQGKCLKLRFFTPNKV